MLSTAHTCSGKRIISRCLVWNSNKLSTGFWFHLHVLIAAAGYEDREMVELVLSCVDRVRKATLAKLWRQAIFIFRHLQFGRTRASKHVNGDKRVFEALAANACIDSGTSQYQYSAVLHRLQSIPRESLAPTRHVTSDRFKIIHNLAVIQEQG